MFNLDESGLSTKHAARAPQKPLMRSNNGSDMPKLNRASNSDHAIVVPVLSVDGKERNTVAILFRALSKYRVITDG